MTREPLEQSGKASAGTWKLSAKGFCTAWGHAKASGFTIIPSGENKWSVQEIATTNHGCNLVEIAFCRG